MERAIPQVKSLPSCDTKDLVAQPKPLPVESGRRICTSAAMLGLAISVGAHGLLGPGSNDSAIAAEPTSDKPTATEAAPVIAATQGADLSAPAKVAFVEHTVQEGQTLQQLARFYGVDVSAVASANHLSIDAVLRVGQVLRIPANTLVARVAHTDTVSSTAPEYYGLVSGARSSATPVPDAAPKPADTALKTEQDAALGRLQQKSEALRQRLAQVQSERNATPATVSQKPDLEKPVEQTRIAVQPKVEQKAEAVATVPPAVPEPIAPAKVDERKAPATAAERSQPETVVALTDSVSYRVTAGDTLSAIARSYGISESQLAAANKISNPNLIRDNQVLTIPRRQTALNQGSAVFAETRKSLTSPTADVPVIGLGTPENSARSDAAQLIEARLQQQATASSEPRVAAVTLPQSRTERSNDVIVPTTSDYSYVENLKSEILRLRERYSAAGVQPSVKVEAVPGRQLRSPEQTATGPVNPEFSPKAYAASEMAQERQPKAQSQAQLPAQPQRVATASLGSQNYEPLTSALLGKMVSPTLPPLGAAEAYLPGKSGKFAGYIWPAQGMLTSGFGWRWGRMHKGIDIAAPIGTPVVAAAPGVVTYADWNAGGYGNLVEITHPDGSVTLYGHNNRILVRQGQEVAQGEQIAEMGSTGYSTGPHSHFEVHLPGQGAVNPIAYLPNGGA